MDARSAREWSSEAAAPAICPNSLRRRCCIGEETDGWSCPIYCATVLTFNITVAFGISFMTEIRFDVSARYKVMMLVMML